ncbi:PP2C-domain-containing protein [Atractiella rhizophila]|nr:PP2C-domain-containing protein [Atractiella rhizophila]
MGQTLSEPLTEKKSFNGEDDDLYFGVSEMQGWRLGMEDSHAHVLALNSASPKPTKASFFAVYDGHGGVSVARYAGANLHNKLAESSEFKEGKWEDSLRKSFLATDEVIRADPQFQGDPSGCTAVAALVTGDKKIYVANAGDSRSVLCSGGVAKPLSFDHKPVNKTENARIVAAGGFVEFGRVNGNLALSRAIGDFEYKKNTSLGPEAQIVTANPDITVHDITDEDEFLILACDGIWDVLTSQQTCDFIRRQIAQKTELEKICENLMDKCLAPDSDWGGVGCDNMTVLVVALLNGRTKEQWYDWVKERVDNKVGHDTPESVQDPFTRRSNLGYGAFGRGGPLSGTLGGGSGIVMNSFGGSRFGGHDE